MKRLVVSVAAALVVAALPVWAAAQETKTVTGTVTAVAADSITVKTASGEMKFGIDAKTDEQGNFTLPGIPSQTKVMLMADALEEPGNSIYLGEITLEPNETRPRTITRLAKDADDAR